jgi:ABC-type phosphate transport system auxiliary subunit
MPLPAHYQQWQHHPPPNSSAMVPGGGIRFPIEQHVYTVNNTGLVYTGPVNNGDTIVNHITDTVNITDNTVNTHYHSAADRKDIKDINDILEGIQIDLKSFNNTLEGFRKEHQNQQKEQQKQSIEIEDLKKKLQELNDTLEGIRKEQ